MPLLLFLLWTASAPVPGQLEARIQQGTAALQANELEKAQLAFEAAAKLAPGDPGVWLLLARTYAKQKNETAALNAAGKAEQLGDSNPRILQGLADFYATASPNPAKAADLGTRYAEAAPQDTTAWRRLAGYCLQAGMPDRAITAGIRGLPTDDSVELHSTLGTAYAQKGDFKNAADQMGQVVRLNPYSEDAHFQLARIYLVQQDFASAVRVLENARRTFDKSAQIELALGVAYYGQRKFTLAVDQFLKTMQLAPDVPQSYLFVSRLIDHVSDRIPELIAQFTGYERRNPRSYLGYQLHAKALIAQLPPTGFPPEAEMAFGLVQKSLSLKEDEPETHYLLGLLLDRKREFEQAASHLERSIQLNAKDPAVHYRLARVYDRLGRREEGDQQRALHEKLSEEEGSPVRQPALVPLK